MNKVNIKINYTPSKNEFFLLIGLLAVVIIALFMNFLILPAWGKLDANHQKYLSEKTILQNLKAEYASFDSYVQKDAELTSELSELRLVVPTYFSEEEIISTLDDVADNNKLKIQGITFSGVTTEPKSSFVATLKLSAANDSSKSTDSSTNKSTNGASQKANDSVYVQSEQVIVSFSASYDNLTGFLSALESNTRQVYFRNVVMTRATDGTLTGTITMLAFSSSSQAPVKNDPNYPGYEFTTPETSGKGNPFAAFPGYGSGTTTTKVASAVDVPNFYIILNTYDDNSNKILMGEYPVSNTQITSDKNQNVAASLVLNSEGDKCNYEYKLGSATYSGSFTFGSGSDLSVSVLSRIRKSSLDNVGITLDVQNNTGKNLTIYVKNDDPSNPRFILGALSGKVQVVK